MTVDVADNIVCPFCGCLCDDLKAIISDGKIVDVKNACIYGLTKFLNYSFERALTPVVRDNNEQAEVDLVTAVDKAARILVDARYPLLYGWSCTSCEAQRIGLELAEEIGGVIDNTTTVCHGPSIEALQDIGESTCTLGEIKSRADLIIYWGSNPLQSHMRHLSRYTIGAEGRFRKTRDDRTMVVIDVRNTYSARVADYFYQVEPNRDYELMSALRVALRDEEIEQDEIAGLKKDEIYDLADMMIRCDFGIVFFGLGLTMSLGSNRNVDAALSLIRDLNKRTKFLIMPMRGHFNVAGADVVFTWQTGYPFAVDFSRGYPRYNPGDTSAVDILLRGENDASLIVASDPVATFPAEASKRLLSNPLVCIDPHQSLTAKAATVAIPSNFVGIECTGTAYRMDTIPLPLKKVVEPPEGCLSDVQLLEMILYRVRELKG